MQLTRYFQLGEFTHTDREEYLLDNIKGAEQYLDNIQAVANELEKLREFIFRPVFITSGYRCSGLNEAIGGVNTSDHLTGSAADFIVKDFSDCVGIKFIFDWCANNLNYRQLILERPEGKRPWIHLSRAIQGRPRSRYIFENGVYKIV